MSALHAREGDAQALKAVIAAKLAGAALTFSIATDPAVKGSNPFGTNRLVFISADGLQLTEANAVANLLGSEAVVPQHASFAVRQWMEWENSVLRPATYKNSDDSLQTAFKHVEKALTGKNLVGSTMTLADVVIYCTLLPLQPQGKLPQSLSAFMQLVAATPAVKEAEAQVLGPKPDEALLSVFKADAEAFLTQRPRLPLPGQRNILITSALPYVNNVPHLGNIIGCVLSADCYARYCRARGYNIIYVCGTDEYGTATETKALEEGLTCQQICDKYHAIHKEIYEWFDIAFDRFGRTPTRWQTGICQSVFWSLHRNEQLVEQSMEQLYSEALGKFLADRFVIGTCPKCHYEDARGDQCDNCGSLLNPTELINPKCKITGTTPVIRSTKHIFLNLPKLSPPLQEYITSTSQLGGWSSNCVQVTNAWMRDGLKNRCITRDLKWGTPVPLEEYKDKVFYVWFDAPIGYISITANYTPDWERWWKNPKDVELVQFMGKDNVPFHTVIFPATLIGTNEPWTMMKNISVTEYLNYEGGKFSKSRGTGVFGNDAKDTGIPVEVWRYYLLSNRPESADTDFKWSDLAAKNNSELLANLGNFINRGLMFVSKFFGGKVPGATAKGAEALEEFGKAVGPKVQEYVDLMERIKLKDGIRLAMAVSADGNKFLQDTKPWVLFKEDVEHCASIVAASVGLVRLLAILIQPFMPSLSSKIFAQLNLTSPTAALLDDAVIKGAYQPHTLVPAGHTIGTPGPMVSQIPDDLIENLRARFGGNQAERDAKAASSAAAPAAGKVAAAVAAAGAKATAAAGAAAKAAGAAAAGAAKAVVKVAKELAASASDTAQAADKYVQSKVDKKGEKKAAAAGGKEATAAKKDDVPPDVSKLDIRVENFDLFTDQPFPKHDVIAMSLILHDWGLPKKKQLLKKAFDALPAGGAFIAVEHLIDDERREATLNLGISLNMLVECGKENAFDYSFEEYVSWCKEVGFTSFEKIHLTATRYAAIAYK